MSYKHIRSLARGVAVLQYLNTVEAATAMAIADGAKLPRPTVYRILDTFIEEGLIYRSPSANNLYRLTGDVRELSDGFSDEDWIATAGRSALEELTAEIARPSDIAVFDGEEMVIRVSTRRSDEEFGTIDLPRTLLGSAFGRAYLAFRPAQEREEILRRLGRRGDTNGELADNARSLPDMLAQALHDGHAICDDSTHRGVAAPILHDGEVLGCIGVEWSIATQGEGTVANITVALKHAQQQLQSALASILS